MRLGHRDPDAGFLVAQHVHGLRRLEHQQAHRFDVDARTGDLLDVPAELGQRLAERGPRVAALDHVVQRDLGLADGAHAVVDAAGAQAELGDLEAAALAEEHVGLRDAHVGEPDVHVSAGGVVLSEDVHRADDLDPRGVDGHEDLRVVLTARAVVVGPDHDDHDLAPWVSGTGDVVLLAVDHPLAVLQHRPGRDVLGVRGGDVRLRHGIGRPDLAVEQRLQPPLLLLGRADPLEDLHVAGVRCGAVHRLRGQRALAELDRDVGVVEIRQTVTGLRVGQEEVPQALLLRPVLGLLQHLELSRREAPAVCVALTELEELRVHRVDGVLDEPLDVVEQGQCLLGHAQVIQRVLGIGGADFDVVLRAFFCELHLSPSLASWVPGGGLKGGEDSTRRHVDPSDSGWSLLPASHTASPDRLFYTSIAL